ncbi:Phosphatase 1 regulatory subunit 42 protein, partial [Globisporangium splendens]
MPPQKTEKNEDARVREINIDALVHATKLSVGKHENLEHYLKRLTHLTLNGDGKRVIKKIQNLQHCPGLKVLYLYDNEIDVMENLDAVPQLTHLHLQNNRIGRMEGLDALAQLEKLYLEGNCIARLEGLQNCYCVQELHLSNQNVPASTPFSFDLQTMQALSRSLRILNLSNCRITSTTPLAMLRNLEQLDLSTNAISELEDVFQLLSSLSSLTELDLRMNPVTNIPRYREKAITFSSSRLALLDKKDIDVNQRRMMQSHLAHKYRKRQESDNPERASSSSSSSTLNETRRTLKHGSTVHQLRSMQITATGVKKNSKLQCEKDGLGVDGAACSSATTSTALVRSSNNNNKHH